MKAPIIKKWRGVVRYDLRPSEWAVDARIDWTSPEFLIDSFVTPRGIAKEQGLVGVFFPESEEVEEVRWLLWRQGLTEGTLHDLVAVARSFLPSNADKNGTGLALGTWRIGGPECYVDYKSKVIIPAAWRDHGGIGVSPSLLYPRYSADCWFVAREC